MMRHRLGLAILLLFAAGSVCWSAQSPSGSEQTTECTRLDINVPLSEESGFAGACGETLICGAGSTVYALPAGKTEWQKSDLNKPASLAAYASSNGKTYLVGGLDGDKVSARVVELSWTNGLLSQRELPEMPQGRLGPGVAVMNGYLYVVGGATDAQKSRLSKQVFRLNIANEPAKGDKSQVSAVCWEELAPMPGAGVVSPTAIGGIFGEVLVFGGFISDGDKLSATADAFGWREKPIDGTQRIGWRKLSPMPSALGRPTVFQTGQSHVAVAGGEDASGNHNTDMNIFHSITDTWVKRDVMPETGLGSVCVKRNNGFVVFGGSMKNAYEVKFIRQTRSLTAVDYVVIVVYFIAMAGIGWYFARKQNSTSEFALGGRNVVWWAAGISMFATGASSISFMAIPAQAFTSNLVWCFPVLFMIPLYFLQAYAIYPLLARLNITSTYEYLERRYHPAMRYVASAQCILFQTFGRIATVLLLPALAITAVTGMNVFTSVLLMGVLTTIYSSFGGFEAVVWTDVVQGFLKMGGAFLIMALAIGTLAGGTTEFVTTCREFGKFDYAIWSFDYAMPIVWISILGLVMSNLAFAGDQTIVQRVFATPMKDVRKLAGIFIICGVLISVIVNFMGLSIFSWFHANPAAMDPTMNNDQVVPLYIVQKLPLGIAGLIIAALFAAAMATISSSMNSVATIFVEDFYGKVRKASSDNERLLVMKLTTCISGTIGTAGALFMAANNVKSIFETWNIIVALLGGGFAGIYILGMFSKRGSTAGAVAGALGSILVTIYLKNFTSLHWVFYTPFAILSCLIIGYIVSLFFPGRGNDLDGLTVFTMKRDHIRAGAVAREQVMEPV